MAQRVLFDVPDDFGINDVPLASAATPSAKWQLPPASVDDGSDHTWVIEHLVEAEVEVVRGAYDDVAKTIARTDAGVLWSTAGVGVRETFSAGTKRVALVSGPLAAKAAVAETASALPTTGTVELDFSGAATKMYPDIVQTGAISFAVGADPIDGAEIRFVLQTDGSGVTFPTGAGNFEPEGWPGGDFTTHDYSAGNHNLRIWWSAARNRAIVDSNPKHAAEIRSGAIVESKLAALAVTPPKASFLGRGVLFGDAADCTVALFPPHNLVDTAGVVDSIDQASRFASSAQLTPDVSGDTVGKNADGSFRTIADETAGTFANMSGTVSFINNDQFVLCGRAFYEDVNGESDSHSLFGHINTATDTGVELRTTLFQVGFGTNTEIVSLSQALPKDEVFDVALSINASTKNWRLEVIPASSAPYSETGQLTNTPTDWKNASLTLKLGHPNAARNGAVDHYAWMELGAPATSDATQADLLWAIDYMRRFVLGAPGHDYLDALKALAFKDKAALSDLATGTADRLLGRNGSGAAAEIAVSAGLTLTGNTLSPDDPPYDHAEDGSDYSVNEFHPTAENSNNVLREFTFSGTMLIDFDADPGADTRGGFLASTDDAVTLVITASGSVTFEGGGTGPVTVKAGGRESWTRVGANVIRLEGQDDQPRSFDGAVVSDLQLKDYSEARAAQSGVTGGITIDFAEAPYHEITHGAGNITGVTINNWPPSGEHGSLVVDYIQDGTGGRTVTHPTGTSWFDGIPTFDTAAGKRNRVTYTTDDGGTSILASYGGAA